MTACMLPAPQQQTCPPPPSLSHHPTPADQGHLGVGPARASDAAGRPALQRGCQGGSRVCIQHAGALLLPSLPRLPPRAPPSGCNDHLLPPIPSHPIAPQTPTPQLLFVDTEGLESAGRSTAYDDRVFALSALLSSLLVYNLPGKGFRVKMGRQGVICAGVLGGPAAVLAAGV